MTKHIRALLALVIFLGLIIVLSVAVIGTTLVQRIRAAADTGTTALAPWQAQSGGAEVLGVTLDGGRVAVRVKIAGGERIEIWDVRTGAKVGTVVVEP